MIYLDSAATTKPCEQATDAILSAMQNSFGNASSLHGMGIRSEKVIASAKKTLLAKLGEGDIIFTSGATESNNTALLGAAETYKRSGDRIVTTAIEHPSVANVMTKLEERGFHVERLAPKDHPDFVQALADKCAQLGIGRIATVMGRYYAMDRDKRWERVQMAYDAMVYGEGNHNADPVDAVARSYANNVTDEFVEPVVCDSDGTISDNDSVIFFNYRPDRAREITRAIVDPDFDGFQREYFPTTYVCNTEYDASMPNVLVAWPRIAVKNGLGEYLSSMGMTQLRIAETEKYAHVTFFFNGGVEKQYPGEDRVLVASPKVATYDLQPEMSAVEVCDKCVERIESGAYDVIILNFANCDMVGHTGVLEAAIKAVETVDTCVGKVVDATLKMGGIAMVTADHGNAEDMKQPDGSPMTAHTTNPVPFILCGAGTELRPGRLADIAPTILDVMGLACPEEMDGKTLIVK